MKSAHLIEKFTYQDYLSLDDDKRYEIIDGELIEMSPGPNTIHQIYSRNIQNLLMAYVYKKKIGHVFNAPLDVRLDEYNVVQPDLIYISEKNKHFITEKNIQGAPDLMMEILSPSSFHHDQERKKVLYERFGVLEYWIIDPANQVIEIFSLEKEKYILHAFVAEKGVASSKLLRGFKVDIEKIKPTEF